MSLSMDNATRPPMRIGPCFVTVDITVDITVDGQVRASRDTGLFHY
jgi:hypothetical protein